MAQRTYLNWLLAIIFLVLFVLIIWLIMKQIGGVIFLLIFNLGAVFTIGLMLATLVSDHKHLTSDHKHLVDNFNRLTKDFREHLKRHK